VRRGDLSALPATTRPPIIETTAERCHDPRLRRARRRPSIRKKRPEDAPTAGDAAPDQGRRSRPRIAPHRHTARMIRETRPENRRPLDDLARRSVGHWSRDGPRGRGTSQRRAPCTRSQPRSREEAPGAQSDQVFPRPPRAGRKTCRRGEDSDLPQHEPRARAELLSSGSRLAAPPSGPPSRAEQRDEPRNAARNARRTANHVPPAFPRSANVASLAGAELAAPPPPAAAVGRRARRLPGPPRVSVYGPPTRAEFAAEPRHERQKAQVSGANVPVSAAL